MHSEPLLLAPTKKGYLSEFFADESNRNLILTDTGKVETKKLSTGPVPPTQADGAQLIQIQKYVGVGGLRVCSTTLLAFQLLYHDHDKPEYLFELLESGLSAKGAPPLVWLFGQLLGNKGDGEKTITPKSLTSVTIQEISPDEFVFVVDARIEVHVKIPGFLMKYVGDAAVDVIEKQGNEAMQTFLDKELLSSLARFRRAFESR
jgi:hypothetical protein